MPIFGLFWVTSWVSCLFGYSQGLFKVPDYLTSNLPAKVLSAVGSPLESYNPLVAQTIGVSIPQTFNSGAGGYDRSLAALPTLGFQPRFGRSQSPSNQAKPTVQAANWPIAVEKRFCRAASEQKDDFQPISPPLASQSVSKAEVSGGEVVKTSLPQRILQVMQNLFRWPDRLELEGNLSSKPKPVVVVRTNDEEEAINPSANSRTVAKRGLWRYSQMLAGLAGAANPSAKQEWPQIWVNGHLMAQIPDRSQAESIAENLESLLSDPNLDASHLEPTLVNGVPGAKLGNSILFVIDKALAKKLKGNPELLAIEWVNNLRTAFGTAPLTLVQAQSRMYGLVETEKSLEGIASWYGGFFHGRLTAAGERYNQFALTAAHPSLPFDTYLKVTNLHNGDAVIVRVNDRGPYIPPRSLDLSLGAARCIKSEETGVVPYSAVIMQPLSK